MTYPWFYIRCLIASLPILVTLLPFIVLAFFQNRMSKTAFWVAFFWLIIPFAVLDVLFNWLVGTFLFLEPPRETLYTNRLKRLDKEPRFTECVADHKRVLNYFDPGHV